MQADIQAPELIDIVAGANPHVIFHLAAQVDLCTSVSDPQFDARSNVLGTINLCEASRQAGVRRIVYAALGESRYGAQACLPVDESNPLDPLSPQAVAKLAEVHGLMSAALGGSALSSVAEDRSDVLHTIALNATKAEKELEWKPKVDLAEGIKRTIRWLCATLEPESPAMVGV